LSKILNFDKVKTLSKFLGFERVLFESLLFMTNVIYVETRPDLERMSPSTSSG